MSEDKKICLYPFTRMETNTQVFKPCCSHWMTDEFYLLQRAFSNTQEDPWNSFAAQELRRRILDGDYSLCRREVCNVPLISIGELKESGSNISECKVSPAVVHSLENGLTKLPHGATSFNLMADSRCNLACPSCRDEKILTLSPADKAQVYQALLVLKNHRHSLQSLKMAGDGEVFFSPWLRKILKIMHKKNFPQLEELVIITNGLLCTPEMYKKLSPGAQSITELSVSIDAGNSETYAITRGGDWNRLQKNLLFISELRKSGQLKRFLITFVVRAANIDSADDFVKMGGQLGCDHVYFLSYSDWNRSKKVDYKKEAINYATHPRHETFLEFFNKYKDNSKVLMGIQPISS